MSINLPHRLALLSSLRPGWAHPKAALSLDFLGNRVWRAGSGVLSIPSAVDTVRASDAWQKDTGGVYQKFGPNALPCLPGIGAAIHAQYTQYFADPAAPATQTVPLAAGTYTCRVAGSGSVTLSGAASGVATDGAPVKFTLASPGSVTCTVAGSPAYVNITNTVYPAPMHLAAGTRLGSDVRAIASGSEPFAGWSAAGLDAGFTVLAEVDLSHIGDEIARAIWDMNDGTANNRARVFVNGSDAFQTAYTVAGNTVNLGVTFPATTGRRKIAMRCVGGSNRMVASATAAVATDAGVASVPVGINRLCLGQIWSGSGNNALNDFIRSIQVCRPLTDAEMDAWVAA